MLYLCQLFRLSGAWIIVFDAVCGYTIVVLFFFYLANKFCTTVDLTVWNENKDKVIHADILHIIGLNRVP